MSLDVYLSGQPKTVECVCECGHTHERSVAPLLFDYNITHNLTEMAREADLYLPLWAPERLEAERAEQLIQPLREGLDTLRSDPERFRAHNPPNGWGDYEGLVRFVEEYLEACELYPDAEISTWR